jgi:hypothetical protein
MALTYAQLTAARTRKEMRQQALDELQGRGVVTKTGTGAGSLTTSGTPATAASVRVRIVAGGELGVATYQVSTDGGVTYASTATVPSSGAVAVGSTGVQLSFGAGPAGAGDSFVAGDLFSFDVSVPSFPVTSWREGDTARSLVEILAGGLAELTALVASIARGGIVTMQPGVTGASGLWLDLIAQQVYGLPRVPAVLAKGNVVLTDAGSAGPFTIAPGQLWFASTSGERFRAGNDSNVVMAKGGTLVLPVVAESPGASYNVASGTITTMLTPLPGVAVANPDNPWRSQDGADVETDQELAAKCLNRWASLGYGSPAASYDLWARTASVEVRRTKVVVNASNASRVDVVLAGDAGPVSAGAVAAVQAFLTPRAPFPSTTTAAAATANAVTVTAALRGKAKYQAAALAAAATAMQSLVGSTPIGGTIYGAAKIAALMSPEGVEDATITVGGGDTTQTAYQVATLTLNLSWVDT